MNFYYFNGGNHIENGKIRELEENGFTGVLFTYDVSSGDYFTRIAKDISEKESIKYMVAIRPHAISPQYLTMITSSIEFMVPNRLQINLISGNIKPNEKEFGGTIGKITDNSNNIDRSNYLIEYIKELERIKKDSKENLIPPDCFISTTNKYVFNIAKNLNQKIILPYREFKQGHWTEYENYGSSGATWLGEKINLNNMEVMIYLSPVIRETKEELKKVSREYERNDTCYFTKKEFNNFIKNLKLQGINNIMVQPWPLEEDEVVLNYVKNFTRGFN